LRVGQTYSRRLFVTHLPIDLTKYRLNKATLFLNNHLRKVQGRFMAKSINRLHAAFVAMLLADITACGGGGGTSIYTVGGTVSGLSAGSSLTLTDGGSDALTVSTNGAFTFKTPLAAGASYAAAISAAPPLQACTVTNGTGTVSSAAVSSVTVICVGPYTSGGTISGLAAGPRHTRVPAS
jgi:hypothetical protein